MILNKLKKGHIPNILHRHFSQIKYHRWRWQLTAKGSQIQLLIPEYNNNKRLAISLSMNSTLSELREVLKQYGVADHVRFQCNEKFQLPGDTPLRVFINRQFYAIQGEDNSIQIDGTLGVQDGNNNEQIIREITNMELPIIIKRQIQNYMIRINKWFIFYTGKNMLDQSSKVGNQIINKIIVNSMIDSSPQQQNILFIYKMWIKQYYLVEQLRNKKQQADELCFKYVEQQKKYIVRFFCVNALFIIGGTYKYFSWSVVQPIMYFTSLLGTIMVASQLFRMRKPYMSDAYTKYLMRKMTPKAYKELGFEPEKLLDAQRQLIYFQSIIKDYFIRKL